MDLWHYPVAFLVMVLLGAAWHGWRCVKLFPDRLTDSPLVDAALLPGGYRWTDMIHETDFDDDGHYLNTWHNVRIAIGLTVAAGIFALLFPEVRQLVGMGIDRALAWMWSMIVHRVDNL